MVSLSIVFCNVKTEENNFVPVCTQSLAGKYVSNVKQSSLTMSMSFFVSFRFCFSQKICN